MNKSNVQGLKAVAWCPCASGSGGSSMIILGIASSGR